MAVSLGRLEVETPDHVVLRYDLAGVGNRGFAALVDAGVALLIVAGAIRVEQAVGGPFRLTGVIVLSALALVLAYFTLLEWLWDGRTLGKRVFGLRVIAANGSPAGFLACVARSLVRLVDVLPGFYGVGALAIVLSPRSQRLGDLVAGTFVVRAPRPRLDWLALRTVTPLGTGPIAEARLSGELQRLVREFVAREAGLVPADRLRVAATIAARLRPLVPDGRLADDTELIRAVARGFRVVPSDNDPRPPDHDARGI
ncbi:MAG: RDD family protein [Candidatus Limnocylindria bacterium]|nr:RDD family protein [Candidatus Limnocylindria bacterium]